MKIEISDRIIQALTKKTNITDKEDIVERIENAILNFYGISIVELQDPILMNSVNFDNYIYIYMDPRRKKKKGWELINGVYCDEEPFYVGKGKYGRSHSHLSYSQNIELRERINSINRDGLEPKIKFIKEGLTNLMAHNIENIIISNLRDQNIKICNVTKQKNPDNYNKDIIIMDLNLERSKNYIILSALNESGTIEEAAKKLNLSPRTLYRKIKSLKIKKTKKGVKNYLYEFE
jgi:hypothetical protein